MSKDFDPASIRIADFDYQLPSHLIPEFPATDRSSSRLLVYRDGNISDHTFSEVESMLSSNDLLVFNNTRVIKARLHFQKISGAEIEIFLLDPYEPLDYARNFASTCQVSWICMIGNAKKWKTGELTKEIEWNSLAISVKVQKIAVEEGKFIIQFNWNHEIPFATLITIMGEIPLPPYIHRESVLSDEDRYQTVYASQNGSVAAPTAGLHFSDELLRRMKSRGVQMAELTLHIGAGTFKPVSSDQISGHEMHSERIILDLPFLNKLNGNEAITAIGTTSVRALESLPYLAYLLQTGKDILHIDQWMPYRDFPIPERNEAISIITKHLRENNLPFLEASTSILIAPSFRFRMIKNMITNFHLPKSTLLLLVSAFIGEDWRKVYQFASQNKYRFLSYGDSSILFGNH